MSYPVRNYDNYDNYDYDVPVRPLRMATSEINKKFLIARIVRVSLAALTAFIVYKGGSALVLGAILMCVSIPAVNLAAGGYLAWKGIALVISAVATGSLGALGAGFVFASIGSYLVREGYQARPVPLGNYLHW